MSGRKTAPFIMIHNVANAIIQLSIVIMISRVLGADAAGQYSLAQSYVMPAFFLGLFALKTQYLIALDKPDFSDYLGLRTFGASAVFIVIILVTYCLEPPLIVTIVVALAFVKLFDGYIDILIGVMQRSDMPAFIGKTVATRLIILLGSFTGVFYITQDMVFALLALGTSGFLHFFLIEYPWCKKHVRMDRHIFDFSSEAISARKSLAISGLPIAMSVLLGAAQLSVLRIFLEEFHGTEILGQFSTTLQVVLIGNLFIVATGQASMPSLSKHFSNRNFKGFAKIMAAVSGFVVLCVFSGAGLSYLVGDWLMEFVFGDDFTELGWLLVFASFSSLPFFLNAFLNQAVIACKLSATQLYVYVLGFCISCILGWIMIENYGMKGAYISIFFVNLAQSIIFLGLVFRAFGGGKDIAANSE